MKTKERGITLIALVVTIIVLLILAGVSIQMLAGQSGILKNAQQAREETEIGQVKDYIKQDIIEEMMANGGEDLTEKQLHDILEEYFEVVPELEGTEWENFPKNFPEKLTTKKEYGKHEIKIGDIYSGTLSGAGNNNKWDETKVTLVDDGEGNIIPVPKGFYYVGGTESTGFVISDVAKDDMNNSLKGNQFVWVPVPDAKSETIVSTSTNTINLVSDSTPMAEKDGLNYRGLLYDEWDVSAKTVKYIQYSEFEQREPDTVTGSGTADSINLQIIKDILDDKTNYENADTFKAIMQKDYNEMVDSVATYGGFYVARYEMSLTDLQGGKKKAQYIKGSISATAARASANLLFGFYAYEKQFATANGYSSVKSSMIWGSQYDAMMNWMARCGEDVTSSIGKDRNTEQSMERTTGNKETDIINNIYDLYGNSFELTLEPGGLIRTGFLGEEIFAMITHLAAVSHLMDILFRGLTPSKMKNSLSMVLVLHFI